MICIWIQICRIRQIQIPEGQKGQITDKLSSISLYDLDQQIYSSLSDISLGHLAFEKKVFPSKTAY